MSALVADDGAVGGLAKSRGRRGVKRLVVILLMAAVLTAAAFYARDWWQNGRFIETTDDAYVGGNSTAIAPHVAGFITRLAVIDNQRVAAGELLVQLDDRDTRVALTHALAVRQQREAMLHGLQARIALQDALTRQADAELDVKVAQASFAQSDSTRYNSLVNTTAVTRQEAERSTSLGKAAKAAVLSAQAALDGAKQQRAVLDAQILEAKAGVAQAEADVASARLTLGYTVIRAPIDGYVGNRAAREGAYASVGSYLMTIVPSQGLWVDANFKEDQLRHVRPGDAASVTLDVASDDPLHGHVQSLAPGTGAVFSVIPPENATGNFTRIVQRVPVRIQFDPRDPALANLRPGLSATVAIDTRAAKGATQ